MMRTKHGRNRDRGADRIKQGSARKPHFALRIQIDRNRGVADRQVLDADIADQALDLFNHAIALDETAAGKRPVEQAQYVEPLQRARPVAIGVELARRVDAADQRAH